MTRLGQLFETSRDPVCQSPALLGYNAERVSVVHSLETETDFVQFVRMTFSACSNPNVRPDVCDKKGWLGLAKLDEMEQAWRSTWLLWLRHVNIKSA